jgi:hypothetical protein
MPGAKRPGRMKVKDRCYPCNISQKNTKINILFSRILLQKIVSANGTGITE